MAVADSGYEVRAYTGFEGSPYLTNVNIVSAMENKTFLLSTILEMNKDSRFRKKLPGAYFYNSKEQDFPSLIINLFNGNTHVGWLAVATDTDTPSIACRQLFEAFGCLVEMWIKLDESSGNL